jgi:hypothetical protein
MGKSYPFIESRHQFYIADKSGFLIIKLWSKQVILQKIGPDLTLQKVMQYENFPKDFTVEKVLEIKGRYYILYSSTAKDVISFFAAQVDVTKGELMDGGKEIATTTKEIEKQSIRFMIAVMILSDSPSVTELNPAVLIKVKVLKKSEYGCSTTS